MTQAFTFEFLNEVEHLGDDLGLELRREAEERLRQLSQDQSDLIGAAVSLESLTESQESSHLYQARVVVYARPENVAAVTKVGDPMAAIKEALDGVERQVRERREKFHQRSRKAAAAGTNEHLYEMSAAELYDTYASEGIPDMWLEISRDEIAADLMREEKLNQDDAFYVADQILAAAADMVRIPEPR